MMIRATRYIFAIALVALCAFAAPAQDISSRLRDDETLVVPGKGAEKLLLADGADVVIGTLGTPERIARFDRAGDLFENVYSMRVDLKIPYDLVYYYQSKKCVVFIHGGKVSAIAGFSGGRITDLPADLSRGVERFILGYGNDGMAVKEKGHHRAYIFGKAGIAVFDDGADGSIDMFLVFKAQSTSP